MTYCVVMRLQAISLFFTLAVGCGGGSDPQIVFVDELSTADQAALCEDFLDGFCTVPGNEVFCDDPCIDTGCTPVASNGGFDDECAPGDVSVDEVLDCADDGTEAVCGTPGTNGPGCIADALAGACP